MFQVITMPARTLAWWLDRENDIHFAQSISENQEFNPGTVHAIST